MNDAPDWTTTEYLANIAADELASAMMSVGIGFRHCGADSDGDVHIAFQGIQDAEALMSLALKADEQPGSLYDRATASCITLSDYGRREAMGAGPTEDQVAEAIRVGWTWMVHPAMHGHVMHWHASVDMPHEDANRLTVNLNNLVRGGVL